jgi:hypothetical protein
VLPVKKPIRVREGLEEHSTVWLRLRVDPDRT